MPEETYFDDAVRESFLLALLLSGSAERAEAAVARGIGGLDGPEEWREALVGAVAEFAVAWAGVEVPTWLPAELQRVLALPDTERRCYVLRVLAGWPSERCAALLGMDSAQVEDAACAAAWNLAGFDAKEQIA